MDFMRDILLRYKTSQVYKIIKIFVTLNDKKILIKFK